MSLKLWPLGERCLRGLPVRPRGKAWACSVDSAPAGVQPWPGPRLHPQHPSTNRSAEKIMFQSLKRV